MRSLFAILVLAFVVVVCARAQPGRYAIRFLIRARNCHISSRISPVVARWQSVLPRLGGTLSLPMGSSSTMQTAVPVWMEYHSRLGSTSSTDSAMGCLNFVVV